MAIPVYVVPRSTETTMSGFSTILAGRATARRDGDRGFYFDAKACRAHVWSLAARVPYRRQHCRRSFSSTTPRTNLLPHGGLITAALASCIRRTWSQQCNDGMEIATSLERTQRCSGCVSATPNFDVTVSSPSFRQTTGNLEGIFQSSSFVYRLSCVLSDYDRSLAHAKHLPA